MMRPESSRTYRQLRHNQGTPGHTRRVVKNAMSAGAVGADNQPTGAWCAGGFGDAVSHG
jgi:hypothetical protein